MPFLLIGLVALWLLLTMARSLSRLPPEMMAKALQRLAAYLAFGIGALFVLRGRIDVAVICLGVGAWFLGVWPRLSFLARRGGRTDRPVSRVRSAVIEMEFDPDTGAMHGSVLAGKFQDRDLDTLSRRECAQLLGDCRRSDGEGARLLEAYLDRRFPGWRAAGEADANAGRREDARTSSGPMTENEAYEILGLRSGASREEITRAHRTLIKKLHPDQGGTTHLAARVNEAKDVLMRRHT